MTRRRSVLILLAVGAAVLPAALDAQCNPATQRLITGLFSAPPGTPTVTALRMSQEQLMDDVKTSHPFYWSAFAAVGDGDIPVIRAPR